MVEILERSKLVIAGSLQFEDKMAPEAPANGSDADALLGFGLGRVV
jgi:hypothetical protein